MNSKPALYFLTLAVAAVLLFTLLADADNASAQEFRSAELREASDAVASEDD